MIHHGVTEKGKGKRMDADKAEAVMTVINDDER